MMKVSPLLILALMLTACFTLATEIGPRAATWSNRTKSDNALVKVNFHLHSEGNCRSNFLLLRAEDVDVL